MANTRKKPKNGILKSEIILVSSKQGSTKKGLSSSTSNSESKKVWHAQNFRIRVPKGTFHTNLDYEKLVFEFCSANFFVEQICRYSCSYFGFRNKNVFSEF
jgi:hypothetical protein